MLLPRPGKSCSRCVWCTHHVVLPVLLAVYVVSGGEQGHSFDGVPVEEGARLLAHPKGCQAASDAKEQL